MRSEPPDVSTQFIHEAEEQDGLAIQQGTQWGPRNEDDDCLPVSAHLSPRLLCIQRRDQADRVARMDIPQDVAPPLGLEEAVLQGTGNDKVKTSHRIAGMVQGAAVLVALDPR